MCAISCILRFGLDYVWSEGSAVDTVYYTKRPRNEKWFGFFRTDPTHR